MKRLPLALMLAATLSLVVGCAAWRSTMARFGVQEYERLDLGAAPIRALWVTRWDYRNERDVRRIIFDAADMGATDIIWQVRGQADAFYDSDIEPWGEELLEDLPPGVRQPPFDPLAIACQLAHGKGLRLHAWFNVMPLWKDRTPPKNR
ncbi:MAG: family 10 glycosylhydrolase, partial [Phycisphaerales bacterium JB038]